MILSSPRPLDDAAAAGSQKASGGSFFGGAKRASSSGGGGGGAGAGGGDGDTFDAKPPARTLSPGVGADGFDDASADVAERAAASVLDMLGLLGEDCDDIHESLAAWIPTRQARFRRNACYS